MGEMRFEEATDGKAIACPKCCFGALVPCVGGPPRIDACGFEIHSFECAECAAALDGLVDPFDDTLLLRELPARSPARTAAQAA
jgi:hypothetical protein